jgi:ADP-ribose pyrophosphatase
LTPKPWKRVELQRSIDFDIFKVNEYRAADPRNGVEHSRVHLDVRDTVSVLALTPDQQAVMVRQFRFGIASNTLELPAGLIEQGEDPAAAAARELEEETGYRPAAMRSLGWFHPNPAWQNNRQFAFVAEGCRRVHGGNQDEGEDIEVELFPLAHLNQLVASGEITHSAVMTVLYLAQLRSPPPAAAAP